MTRKPLTDQEKLAILQERHTVASRRTTEAFERYTSLSSEFWGKHSGIEMFGRLDITGSPEYQAVVSANKQAQLHDRHMNRIWNLFLSIADR